MGFKVTKGNELNNASVSQEGVAREEAVKKKDKLANIFKAFDISGDGVLDSKELLNALDVFNSFDKNHDGEITTKELKEMAEVFNSQQGLSGQDALKSNNLRAFWNNIKDAVKGDAQISRNAFVMADAVDVATEQARLQKFEDNIKADVISTTMDIDELNFPEKPVKEPEVFSYTVQNGESFNDLITRILKAQGIENPTPEDIAKAKEEFKKANPDAVHRAANGVEYLLVGDKVNLPVDLGDKNNADEQIGEYAAEEAARKAAEEQARFDEEEAARRAAQEAATQAEIEAYEKKTAEAKAIADELFNICDKKFFAIGSKAFQDAMNKLNKDNIVEVLNQYDAARDSHKGDTSLMDTIRSEGSNVLTEWNALDRIINLLADAAKDAGVADADIQKAVNDFITSKKEQYHSAHAVNPKDMEKAVDFLRGAIEAKRQEANAVEMKDTEAMQTFSEMFAADDATAQEQYSTAREEEGWAAKAGDWVCGLFGCNTIKEMNEKLGTNAKDAVRLAEAAQSGDEAKFKEVYKEVFGIDFDSQKIATREGAVLNYEKAAALTNSADICSDILENTSHEYGALKDAVKENFGFDDETIEQIISCYEEQKQFEAADDNDKALLLLSFVEDTKANMEKEIATVSKGRSLAQMEKDVELLTKAAYGTKDIVKDVVQFNQNQKTTEMVTLAAAEIAGTVALQFVPGLGQVAAARLAATAATWGVRAANVVKVADAAAKTFETVKNLQNASKFARAATNVLNTATATAIVDSTNGEEAKDVLNKMLMNSTFAGIGSASSVLTPQIAKQFGISSTIAKEVIEESLNAAGAAGYIKATGGEYKLSDAGIDFVTAMVLARISHINPAAIKGKSLDLGEPVIKPETDIPVPDSHKRTYEPPVVPDDGSVIRFEDVDPVPEPVHNTVPDVDVQDGAVVETVHKETPFEKATKNGNNPDDIAPQTAVGKIGDEKFEGFVDEVSTRTKGASDAELDELTQRADALRSREQRRTLQGIVGNEKAMREIAQQTNLGDLYRLEREVMQWGDSSPNKKEILEAIANRRQELQSTGTFTIRHTDIDPAVKENALSALTQQKRHLNSEQLRDIRLYVESLTDPAELNRVVAELNKRTKIGGKLKRSIDAKYAELNIDRTKPVQTEPVQKPVDDAPDAVPSGVTMPPDFPTPRLDRLNPGSGRLGGLAKKQITDEVLAAINAAKPQQKLPALRNKVNQKILNTEFRDGLLAKIDDAAANFKPQKPLPAGVTSETRGVTDSPDPVKEEAVTPKKVDSENAKRTEEAKHAEKIRRDYYQRIKSIHFSKDGGLYSRELKMYENFQRAMHKLLIATDGKVKLPENIRFRDIPQRSTGLACYETGTLDISVNRCFLDNIDSMLKDLVKDLQDVNMLNVDIDGKIHIPDFLKNDITLKLENKLNAYNDTMSLADKFEIYSQMGYYASLQSQIRRHPHITIEKIMKNGDNISALKEQGLYKTKQEVTAMNKDEQIAYLKQIAAITGIPENAVLIRDGAQVYLHELGHLNQASNCSKEDYYTLLHSKELIEEHQNNSEIQDICSKVSRYAQSQPSEFVAEVFSGLAAGQKFDADVMALYAKYKGPQLFD